MPTEAARWFSQRVSQSLIAVTPPSLGTRRAYILDGTTITLAPEPELKKWFPPASNQHGVGAFPVALLVVAHALASGAALVPEIGVMYGPQAVSETSLIDQVLAQLPPDSVVMADAGLGIFTVAYAAQQAGHKHVLRLTPVRFEALRRQAKLVSQCETTTTRELDWRPICSRYKDAILGHGSHGVHGQWTVCHRSGEASDIDRAMCDVSRFRRQTPHSPCHPRRPCPNSATSKRVSEGSTGKSRFRSSLADASGS